jgi:DnaJ-class molecular chaperone
VKNEYRELAKKFHPDVIKDGRAMVKINELYQKAHEQIVAGKWELPNILMIKGRM